MELCPQASFLASAFAVTVAGLPLIFTRLPWEGSFNIENFIDY